MEPDYAKAQDAVDADRTTVRKFVDDIICHDTAPVHDYITDLDERCALFGELQQLHQDLVVPEPNMATLAFFMVAPTCGIREHLTNIRTMPHPNRAQYLDHINLQAPAAMSAFIPTHRVWSTQQPVPKSPPSATLGTQGDAERRSKAVARDAIDRDRNVCLLSGMSDPKAASVFPFAASKRTQYQYLNTLLQCFWGIDKALAWRRLYTEVPAITESPINYLSLNHQLCFWLDKAKCALKPLSQTQTTIILQFHWLRKSNLSPITPVLGRVEAVLDWAGLRTDLGTWGSLLAHRASGMPIRTGQTFLIRARHPAELPSFELLELQWNLLRVAAICGAPDVEDEADSDVDDDY